MRTEEEIAKAHIDSRLAGKPQSVLSLIVEDLVRDAMMELRAQINALVEQELAKRAQQQ